MSDAPGYRYAVVLVLFSCLAAPSGWATAHVLPQRDGATQMASARAAYDRPLLQAAQPTAEPTPPPPIHAIAELYRPDPASPAGPPTDLVAYPLLPSSSTFAWPTGNLDGGLETGIGMLLLTDLVRDFDGQGAASELSIHNPVPNPGFTDIVIYFFDANGLLDYVCQKLNERQVEFIDLATWGYINEGYRGHAIVSAYFWEHDLFEGTPETFQRNLLGVAASVVERDTIGDGHDALSSVRWAIPMDIGRKREVQDAFVVSFPPLCPGFGEGRFQEPTRTPNPAFSPTPTPTASPTPTFTPTPTPWPTPRHAASIIERAPALRFPAAAGLGVGADSPTSDSGTPWTEDNQPCTSELIVYNPGPREAKALLVAQPSPYIASDGDASEPVDCAKDFEVFCSGLIAPQRQWRWLLPERLAEGAALTVLSLDRRDMRSAGFDASGTFADHLCATLERQLNEGCLPWPALLEAWRSGEAYSPHPDDMAGPARIPIPPGVPLLGEVRRSCDGATLAMLARSDTDLGWSPVGGEGGASEPPVWTYGLPLPAGLLEAGPPDGGDGGSGGNQDGADPPARVVAHVMAATGVAGEVAVSWLSDEEGAPHACGRWPLPGGASLALDLGACIATARAELTSDDDPLAPLPGAGALRITADVPLSAMVDVETVPIGDPAPGAPGAAGATHQLVSLPASPLIREDPITRSPLGAGDDTAFAPLLYHGYKGWRSRLRVHNPDVERPANMRVTIMNRSGDALGVRDIPWVSAGGSFSLELHDVIAPLSRERDGVLHARVERLPDRALTPTPPGPTTPTATPAAFASPTPRPATRVAPPTATAAGPFATPTVAFGPRVALFLPITLARR